MEIKTDVLICTYNSGRYLDECLKYIVKTIPVNRILIADHDSTDNTLNIARKYRAIVIFEKVGLSFARNILMELSETEIITWIDSDFIVKEKGWWEKAYNILVGDNNIVAVVARVKECYEPERERYVNWWWTMFPRSKKLAFVLGATLMRRKDTMELPKDLNASEDTYMSNKWLEQKRTIREISINGTHYFDYSTNKAYWHGANMRILGRHSKINKSYNNMVLLFIRRILPSVAKAIPPAIYYRDFSIIKWNMNHWVKFLIGWMNPETYTKMERK
jgi:glycosyltransferase involved in cell wall biosynthesis